MSENIRLCHSILDDENIPTKGPFEALSLADRITALVAMYHHTRDANNVLRDDLKKKTTYTTFNLMQISKLVYPIMMTQMAEEISESKAAELIGLDIVSVRELKTKTIKSIMDLIESLPSPLILLLDTTKDQQPSSTKT